MGYVKYVHLESGPSKAGSTLSIDGISNTVELKGPEEHEDILREVKNTHPNVRKTNVHL